MVRLRQLLVFPCASLVLVASLKEATAAGTFCLIGSFGPTIKIKM
jgi:hypothetical protein